MGEPKYRQKRKFDETPEPDWEVEKSDNLPLFCIQKHDASHLHYDFRLEHKGVMLSWAVPKGPSLNPSDKRLALQVEDHPFEYRNFEGNIPKGNYGAGTVMIWDEGHFGVKGAETKKEIEKAISAGLKKGHLEFVVVGSKLKGGFDLVKLKTDKDTEWLLIKSKDKLAKTSYDITKYDYSARSGLSLKEIEEGRKVKKKSLTKAKIPEFFTPMLATLVDSPFDNPDWIFETKWDGYRALAFIDKKVNLLSRNQNSFNEVFAPIAKELSKVKMTAVLDGEMVILDQKGKSDFQEMQNYQTTQKGALFYYVFDIPFLEGEDLRDLPLLERKERLKSFLEAHSFDKIRYSEHIANKGKIVFKKAAEYDLEGIIAKRSDSKYVSRRTRDWLKIKTHHRQEAIIIGFTAPQGGRKGFGALLLAVYNDKKELTYIGHVGTGFTDKALSEIKETMDPLIQTKCPIDKKVRTNMPATWLKPKLVCEVSFTEWTHEGSMRHPTFEGLRIDKKAKDVKKEKEVKL